MQVDMGKMGKFVWREKNDINQKNRAFKMAQLVFVNKV